MILAHVHSDDRVYQADFDATPWFKQASNEEIADLAASGWANDYPADNVAIFMADLEPRVAGLWQYLDLMAGSRNAPGFECKVNASDAAKWLKTHRPSLIRGGKVVTEWGPKDWSPKEKRSRRKS